MVIPSTLGLPGCPRVNFPEAGRIVKEKSWEANRSRDRSGLVRSSHYNKEVSGHSYRVIENTAAGPDEGIDLVLKKNGGLVLVQCKQWKSAKVGVNIVRELFGVMTDKKATSGVLITSGIFTQEAMNFAGDKPIDLVDGTQLLQMVGKLRTK